MCVHWCTLIAVIFESLSFKNDICHLSRMIYLSNYARNYNSTETKYLCIMLLNFYKFYLVKVIYKDFVYFGLQVYRRGSLITLVRLSVRLVSSFVCPSLNIETVPQFFLILDPGLFEGALCNHPCSSICSSVNISETVH